MSEDQAAYNAAVPRTDPERTADVLLETLTKVYEEYATAYHGGAGETLDTNARP